MNENTQFLNEIDEIQNFDNLIYELQEKIINL